MKKNIWKFKELYWIQIEKTWLNHKIQAIQVKCNLSPFTTNDNDYSLENSLKSVHTGLSVNTSF